MTITPVYLEVGTSRTFACALDWPGWSRSGKTEEAALAALADYAPRYAEVAAVAGVDWPSDIADTFRVAERLPGTMTTNFGAPDGICAYDRQPLAGTALTNTIALVRAAWTVLDRIAAQTPAGLRKGPRGGGRDRDKMLGHILGAETSYARKIGVKRPVPQVGDVDAIEALRRELIAELAGFTDPDSAKPASWPPLYAARRVAWHALDHAWEMQDRTD